MLSRVMAGCLALAAFAIAIIAGLAADNAAGAVLVRALIAMMACYPVGLIVGMICERVIAMHIESQPDADASEPAAMSPQAEAHDAQDEEVITV